MNARKLTFSLIIALFVSSAPAHAQSSSPPAQAVSTPLNLDAQLGDSKLNPETVRHALELELKRPVLLSPAQASDAGIGLSVVAHPDHTVTVSYRDATGTTRARTIGVPQDPARGAEVIALLAGNLSRDEAAELLAALAAQSAAATTNAASADAAPPVPAPVPAPKNVKLDTKPAPSSAASAFPKPYPAFNLTLFAPLALYPRSKQLLLSGELGLFFSHVGELHGVGLNAFALHVERNVVGTSIATFYNHAGGTVHGTQLAAVSNSAQALHGVQLSGISNVAGDVQGVQLSGVSNVARAVHGVQIGLINVAGDVDGAQIGLVNIAKHVHGTSLGLVSIAGNGRVQPVFWVSTFMPLNAAAKFTVGALYTEAGAGYAPGNQTYVWELGVGAHLQSQRYFFEPGVHYSEMRSARRPFDHELMEDVHYRAVAGVTWGDVSPFVGVSLVQRFSHTSDAPSSHPATLAALAGLAFF